MLVDWWMDWYIYRANVDEKEGIHLDQTGHVLKGQCEETDRSARAERGFTGA